LLINELFTHTSYAFRPSAFSAYSIVKANSSVDYLRLPQGLRDQIYAYALHPGTVFIFTAKVTTKHTSVQVGIDHRKTIGSSTRVSSFARKLSDWNGSLTASSSCLMKAGDADPSTDHQQHSS
jgi:hypothetical protein